MKVLLIGHVDYTIDNAAQLRCLEVAKALMTLGHEVTVYDGLNFSIPVNTLKWSDVRFVHPEYPKGRIEAFVRRVGVGLALFWQKISIEKFDVIYCYGSELSWQIAGWRLARRMGARLLVDITELYGFEEMTTSFSKCRSLIGTWIGILGVTPLFADCIAVPSRRFARLMRRLHSNVFLLPPFFSRIDLEEEPDVPEDCSKNHFLRLVYAGSPGGKEQLFLIVQALALVPKRGGYAIQFDLAGLSQEETASVIRAAGAQSLLQRSDILIRGLGRIQVERARLLVSRADFLIVIRKQSRRVNFGFPSKVAESFSLGVPVISNCYSDIPRYVCSYHNGMLIKDDSAEALRDCLVNCQNLSKSNHLKMRQGARSTWQNFFSASAAAFTLNKMLQA